MPFNTNGQPHGQGKSEHKYIYKVSDIAKITGLKRQTIRTYAYKKIIDLNDLESVCRFITSHYPTNNKLKTPQTTTHYKTYIT